MMPFERLLAWQHSHALALDVYRATARWPADERYGLTAQARRAAFSVAANIAEGSAKRWGNDFQRFLNMSLGSHSELVYTLRLAEDLGLSSQEELNGLKEQLQSTGKLIWKLYEVQRKRGQSRDIHR